MQRNLVSTWRKNMPTNQQRLQQAKNDADAIRVPDVTGLSYKDKMNTLKNFERSSDMVNIRYKYPEFRFIVDIVMQQVYVVSDFIDTL